MSRSPLESATLFTPGRASYLDENDVLQLSEASQRRADVAAVRYDPNYHDAAVFAGGFPGLSQHWEEALTPPVDRREAHLMAIPLVERLRADGKSPGEIAQIVSVQGDSSNSFGDVILSVQKGLLDPNRFNTDLHHGIALTSGALHGRRFRSILSKALDIDPNRIQRVKMRDIYGTPDHPRQRAESMPKAIVKEMGALALTEMLLRSVRSGDLKGLQDAEQRFIYRVSKHS